MSLLRPIRLLMLVVMCLSGRVDAWAATEEQRLDLSAYVGTADGVSDVVTDESGAGRSYLGFQGSTTFERVHPKRTFTASLAGSARYFLESREFLSLDRSASVGFDAQLSGRNHLRATQTVQYSPYRQFWPAMFGDERLGELPVDNPDGAAMFGQAFFHFGTLVELSRRLSQRNGLSIQYASSFSVVTDASENPISQRVGIGFSRVLGRYAALRLGTGYRFGRTGYAPTASPTKAQDFDIGVDYNRPLSFSRGTTLSFRSGTALVSQPGTASNLVETDRQLVAIAGVTATQTIGRYWKVQLGFDRNLQYIEGFPDPFYASRVMSGFTGQIGRRFSVLAEAAYSTGGGVGPVSLAQNFRGLQSQARINYVLGRRWQLFAAHYFTENRLSAEALRNLPPGVMLRPNQASIQAGLNFHID